MVRHPLTKRRNTTASGPEQKNVHPAAELVIDEDRCRAELWDTIDGERTFIGFIGYALEDRIDGVRDNAGLVQEPARVMRGKGSLAE